MQLHRIPMLPIGEGLTPEHISPSSTHRIHMGPIARINSEAQARCLLSANSITIARTTEEVHYIYIGHTPAIPRSSRSQPKQRREKEGEIS
jgi:hypothetical protein